MTCVCDILYYSMFENIYKNNQKPYKKFKEIITPIPKREMKELLYLGTKNVHFSFNNDYIYIYTYIYI